MLRAIKNKKHIVTANKHLLAVHGDELFQAAEKAGVDIYFEASVCAGVPVIRALREGLASDRIQSVYGIVNGTSNYILTTMREQGRPFAEVLSEAQEKGYAEADPALDVDGGDAAHKLAILMMTAFGNRIRYEDIYVEGIRHLEPIDFEYAERFGYLIKLLAIARDHEENIEARVHPAMIPKTWLLASVNDVNNAIYVSSYALGRSMYYGRGAGMMPTAMAVVSDVIEVARNILADAPGAVPMHSFRQVGDRPIRDMRELVSRYYMRFQVADEPGVLAMLTRILADHRISLAQVHQEAHDASSPATILMLTHAAREADVRAALQEIEAQAAVSEGARVIRLVE